VWTLTNLVVSQMEESKLLSGSGAVIFALSDGVLALLRGSGRDRLAGDQSELAKKRRVSFRDRFDVGILRPRRGNAA
jgi:hypothetical protein